MAKIVFCRASEMAVWRGVEILGGYVFTMGYE